MTAKIRLYGGLALSISLFTLAVLVWWNMRPAPWVPAKPVLQDVPKVAITVPKVKVYAPAAKKKLKLPPAVQDDPDKHVTDATVIPPSKAPTTVVTLIDEVTGESSMIVRVEPTPWIAFERHGQLRIDYGFKGGQQVARLSFQQDLVQVKALHAGINTTLDTDGDYFVGVGVGFKW